MASPSFMSEMLAAGLVTHNEIASTDSYTIVSRIWDTVKDTALLIIGIAIFIEYATNYFRAKKSGV